MVHGEHVLPHTLYALFTIHFNFWAMKTSLTCPIILLSGSYITTTVLLVRSLILHWVGFSTVLNICISIYNAAGCQAFTQTQSLPSSVQRLSSFIIKLTQRQIQHT